MRFNHYEALKFEAVLLNNRQTNPMVTIYEEGVKLTQKWFAHIVGFNFIFVSEHHIDQILKRYLSLCLHTPVPSSLSSKSVIFIGLGKKTAVAHWATAVFLFLFFWVSNCSFFTIKKVKKQQLFTMIFNCNEKAGFVSGKTFNKV